MELINYRGSHTAHVTFICIQSYAFFIFSLNSFFCRSSKFIHPHLDLMIYFRMLCQYFESLVIDSKVINFITM